MNKKELEEQIKQLKLENQLLHKILQNEMITSVLAGMSLSVTNAILEKINTNKKKDETSKRK